MTQMKKKEMGVTERLFCSQGPQVHTYFSNNYTVNSLSQAVQERAQL